MGKIDDWLDRIEKDADGNPSIRVLLLVLGIVIIIAIIISFVVV